MAERTSHDIKVQIAEAVSPMTSVFQAIPDEPLASVKYIHVHGTSDLKVERRPSVAS